MGQRDIGHSKLGNKRNIRLLAWKDSDAGIRNSFKNRWTHSCLCQYTGQFERGLRADEIARLTGAGRRKAVPRSLERLRDAGLVEERDGLWWAIEKASRAILMPSDTTRSQGRWPLRYVALDVYLMANACPLSPIQNAVFWLHYNNKRLGRFTTEAGAAIYLSTCRKTVGRANRKLHSLGLLRNLHPTLTEDRLSWWQDQAERKCVTPPPADFNILAYFDLPDSETEEKNVAYIRKSLLMFEKAMVGDGWTVEEMVDFWTEMWQRVGRSYDAFSDFCHMLPSAWKACRQATQRNREEGLYRGRSCRGLLKSYTGDLIRTAVYQNRR